MIQSRIITGVHLGMSNEQLPIRRFVIVIDADTIAVILTVALAVGGAYVGISRNLAQLGERLAKVEGIIAGWVNPPPKTTSDRS